MMIYAVCLSMMIQYGNPIVASFGFTYQSTFISLYLFQSIFMEVPDFFLRLFIMWNYRRYEYEADGFASKNGFNCELRKALIVLAVKNEDHMAPDDYHTMVYKSHPSFAQRIEALIQLDTGSKGFDLVDDEF